MRFVTTLRDYAARVLRFMPVRRGPGPGLSRQSP